MDTNNHNHEPSSRSSHRLAITVYNTHNQIEQQTSLSEEHITIGRDPSATILLNSKLVSRQHLELKWDGVQYVAYDLGSRIGTKVHGGGTLSQPLPISEVISLLIGTYRVELTPLSAQASTQPAQVSLGSTSPTSLMPPFAENIAAPVVAAPVVTAPVVAASRPKESSSASSVPIVDSSAVRPPPNQPSLASEPPQDLIRLKRNVDLQWQEPLDVFIWSNIKFTLIAALVLSIGAVLYWSNSGEILKGGALSSAHSGPKFNEALLAHNSTQDTCSACHTSALPAIDNQQCITCHDTLQSQGGFHTLHGRIWDGDESFNCADCHIEHPQKQVKNSLITTSKCVGCHPSSDDADVSQIRKLTRHTKLNIDPKLPSGLTINAMITRQIGLRASSNPLAIHALHSGIDGACIGCHANADRSASADPKSNCLSCHAQQTGSQLIKTDVGCIECHTPSVRLTEAIKLTELSPKLIESLPPSTNPVPEQAAQDEPKELAQTLIPSHSSDSYAPVHPLLKFKELIFILATILLILLLAFKNKLYSKRDRSLDDLVLAQNLRVKGEAERPKKLINIFDDACVGCGECVVACPYDVLEVLTNKDKKIVARVVNFDSCNECNDCVVVCKPQALTRLNPGEPLPMIDAPSIDAQYMTNVYGLYLIGEASGTSLVRNANNLGAKVAHHINHRGDRSASPDVLDVLIVGAGPAGVSAGLMSQRLGLRYALLEQSEERLNILATQYPKGKQVQNQPTHVQNIGPLPMDGWDILTKEELLQRCAQVMDQEGLDVKLTHKVTGIEQLHTLDDGVSPELPRFVVQTNHGDFKARNLILAIGARGAPRTFGCPGDDHSMIHYHLADPESIVGRKVTVVGGGNSALEAAIAVAEANEASGLSSPLVTLVYRGEVFKKASDRNNRLLKEAEDRGLIRLVLSASPCEVVDGLIRVKIKGAEGATQDIETDTALCLVGSLPPSTWLKKVGIEYDKQPQGWKPSQSDDLTFLEL